jgi:pimeloyl-ACP methyl ester carboxylesterase
MKAERVVLGDDEDPVSPDARIGLLVTRPTGATDRLAVILHGRNGAAEAPHMDEIAAPYRARGYTVVLPDLSASEHNASAGTGADFTLEGQVRDALRTADWALATFGARRIALAGHSMGAYAAGLLAATRLRAACRHLLLVAPFVSGRRQIEARAAAHPDGLRMLARELPQALTDWPRHDLTRQAARIAAPTAVVFCECDTVASRAAAEELLAALPAATGLTVLAGAQHCLEGGPHGPALAGVLDRLEAAAR